MYGAVWIRLWGTSSTFLVFDFTLAFLVLPGVIWVSWGAPPVLVTLLCIAIVGLLSSFPQVLRTT